MGNVMNPKSRKVIEYIDRNKNRILDFLCVFVSKKSINHGTPGTGDELEAQNWVRDRFQEIGMEPTLGTLFPPTNRVSGFLP
jgi:hypothetical protein